MPKKKKKKAYGTGQKHHVRFMYGFTLKVRKNVSKESSEIDVGFWFQPLSLRKDTDCCHSGKPRLPKWEANV